MVATDTVGVGTARRLLAAAGYGSDKAIFGYGYGSGAETSITNLVSNTGVVATDTVGVGTARYSLAAAGYGTDKAIFGYGNSDISGVVSITIIVRGRSRHISYFNSLHILQPGTNEDKSKYTGRPSVIMLSSNLIILFPSFVINIKSVPFCDIVLSTCRSSSAGKYFFIREFAEAIVAFCFDILVL